MITPPRVLPYLLAFAEERFEKEYFPQIREESESAGVSTSDPARFLQLRSVGPLLRDVLANTDRTAVEQFGPLLFQAYHFWRYEKQVFAFEDALGRSLLEDAPVMGSWEMVPPAPAGYLQLPRHLLWARVAEDAQAEAIDGLFWTMVGENDPAVPPSPRLDLLLVLGLVTGRPGFSIAELVVELGDEPQGHWGDAQMRESGNDFANILPGGELQRFHGIESTGEVLKLVSRCFWYIAQNPDSIQTASDGDSSQQRVSSDG